MIRVRDELYNHKSFSYSSCRVSSIWSHLLIHLIFELRLAFLPVTNISWKKINSNISWKYKFFFLREIENKILPLLHYQWLRLLPQFQLWCQSWVVLFFLKKEKYVRTIFHIFKMIRIHMEYVKSKTHLNLCLFFNFRALPFLPEND